MFQRCIGTRLPEASQLGTGDVNEEWRRLVINEWRRYEAAAAKVDRIRRLPIQSQPEWVSRDNG
jgi:hypothetical protein